MRREEHIGLSRAIFKRLPPFDQIVVDPTCGHLQRALEGHVRPHLRRDEERGSPQLRSSLLDGCTIGVDAPVPPVLSGGFRVLNPNGEVTRSGYFFRIHLPNAMGASVPEP